MYSYRATSQSEKSDTRSVAARGLASSPTRQRQREDLPKTWLDTVSEDIEQLRQLSACLYGRSAVSDLLIRSGAKTVVLTEHYQSCLHLLANQSTERFLETARILLSHNCDPNTLDDDGLAPLHRASLEMVHILASSDKTDLNILSQAGDTPLLTAAKDRREAALLALIHVEQEHQQAALAASELSGARASANRTPSSKSAGSTTSRFTLLTNGSLSTYAVTNSVATPNRQSSGWAQRVFRTASAATIQLQSATSAVFSGSTRPTLVPFAFRQPQPQQQPQPPIELQTLTVADSVTPLPPNTNLSDTKRRKDSSVEGLPPRFLNLQKVVKPRLNLNQPDNIGKPFFSGLLPFKLHYLPHYLTSGLLWRSLIPFNCDIKHGGTRKRGH
ncbi:unnamed protein product [Schistocephalus solidus]|uniref:ANK_REP_REGION domain-containing protein n=1 Tax=Schistocephalus solidus TaxID=70667 RepID=A0A183S8Y2_SCHSO|nr:unnamed protein product [Schistocephalus solidus]